MTTARAEFLKLERLVLRAAALVRRTVPNDEAGTEAARATLARLVDEALTRPVRPSPYDHVRDRFPNAGKAWRAADAKDLRRLFTAGTTLDDLSTYFGRTPNGVRVRLLKLGLLEETPVSRALAVVAPATAALG